ncbi:MAG: hypothetical protein Q9213_001094 [Squamulea squamosa]
MDPISISALLVPLRRTALLLHDLEYAPVVYVELLNQLARFQSVVDALQGQSLDSFALQSELRLAEKTLLGISRFFRLFDFADVIRDGSKDNTEAEKLLQHLETHDVQAYSITVNGRVITFVDTPGFDDTFKTNLAILEQLASWLTEKYQSSPLLSGIIFLHPITDVNMVESAAQSLKGFDRLVGPNSSHNIVLVTTMWEALPDMAEGKSLERLLHERNWRLLIEEGSITARFYGDRKSALAVMEKVAFDQGMARTLGAPLTLQKEIVDEQKPLEPTSACEKLIPTLDEVQKSYQDQLQAVEPTNSSERNRMQKEIDKLRSRVQKLLRSLAPAVIWSYQITSSLFSYSWFLTSKVMRPRLQKGYTQIEWQCVSDSRHPTTSLILIHQSCGVLLYGDYIARSTGSLEHLAAQLNGRIVARSTTQSSLPNDSNIPLPTVPAQARTRDQSSALGASGQAPQTIHSSQGSFSASDTDIAADPVSYNSSAPSISTTPKWLELCIRSGPNNYFHEEIDVAVRQTDELVFHNIREKYRIKRAAVRLFNQFDLRIPNGGVFVQFRKDKLATTQRMVPTASIMACPSVPQPKEARDYHYVFDPIPMDEPPMDPRTFNHYLQNPHLGDHSETWIKRFPQLEDTSLFYSNEKLAKGWGIEITEDRNWTLIVCVNLLVLLLSGATAAIYGYCFKDAQTGVAIGAWLSTMQTLGVTCLFWQWTS